MSGIEIDFSKLTNNGYRPISDIQVTEKLGFERRVRVKKLSYLFYSVPYMFMDLS